ncbi:MAG: type restriction enzyme subunit [Actinomycetota bacterium]|jgi:type I restriction enzyme S subunit|nr:type restriction enzyme subunit [Actinomycetota bacterium]
MSLPAAWVVSTLGEVATWSSGGTPKATNPTFYGGDIPWAVIGDLTDAAVPGTATCITDNGLAASSAKVVEPGTILVAMYGSIGKLGIAGIRMATNQAIACAVPGPAVSRQYLFWYLRSIRADLQHAGKGATQKNIGQGILKSWPIPLPPLAEQQRMVAAIEEQLSRIDAAEESLLGAEARIRQLRESCMAIQYETDWQWTTLGEIAEVVGGVTKDAKREQLPGLVEVPYLRVANVQRGFLDLSEVATIRVPPERAKALMLEPGDVLLNEGGDRDKLGRGWVWNGEIPDCIHQNHVFRARVTVGFAPKFLSWHANTYGRVWFQDRGSQTTNLASISRTNLRGLPVPAPPLEVQVAIAEEIDRRLSVVSAVEKEAREARRRGRSLRQAVLRDAFAGRLVTPETPERVDA